MKKAIRSLFGKKKSPRETTQPNGLLLTENEAIEHKDPSPSSRFYQGSSFGISKFGGRNKQPSTGSGTQLINEAREQPLDDRSSVVIHHNRPEPYDPRSVREIIQLQQRIHELEMNQQENVRSTRDSVLPQKHVNGRADIPYRTSITTASSSVTGSSHQVNVSHPSQVRRQESGDVDASAKSSHRTSKTTNLLSNTLPVVRPLVDRSRVGMNHTFKESPTSHVGDIPGPRRLYSQDPVALTNGGSTSGISKEITHNSHSDQARYRKSAPAGPVASKNEAVHSGIATTNRDSCSTHTHHSRSIYGSGNPYVYYDTLSGRTSLSAEQRGAHTVSPHPLDPRISFYAQDQGPLATPETNAAAINGIALDGEGNLKNNRGKRIRKTLSIHWNSKEKRISSKVIVPEADERPSQSGMKTASVQMGVSLRTNSLSRAATINRSATKTLGSATPSVRGPRPIPELRDFNRETQAEKILPLLPQKKLPIANASTCAIFDRVAVESENGMTTTTSTSRSGSCSEEDEDREREGDSTIVSYTRSTPGRGRYRQRNHRDSSPKHHSHAIQQQQLQQKAVAAPRINTWSEPRNSLPRLGSQERQKEGKVLTAMDEFVNDTEEYIRKNEKSIENNPYHSIAEQQLREQAFIYAQRKAKERRILQTQSQENAQSPVLSPAQIPSQNKSKGAARSSTGATVSVRNSILKKISTSSRFVGPIKRPTLDSVISGNNGVSRSTPASFVPTAKRSSNTLSNSNTTASKGTARRIIYSADLEQGLPKGRVAREGNFEIVPQSRGSGQFSAHSASRASGMVTGKQLSGYEAEIYPDYTPKEEISDGDAKRVVVANGTVLTPEFHSQARQSRQQQQQQQHVEFSQEDRAGITVPITGN